MDNRRNKTKVLEMQADPKILRQSIALWRAQWPAMLLLNFAWVILFVPLVLALAFPAWPYGLRIALSLFSVFALIPATAALYAILHRVCDGASLGFDLAWQGLKAQFVNAFTRLLPLNSLLFWLILADRWAIGKSLFIEATIVRLLILILAVLSLYWGPTMVDVPALSAIGLFIASYKLFWHRPGKTLLAGLSCLLILVLGAVTILGMLLIAPVLLVLVQLQLFRAVAVRR